MFRDKPTVPMTPKPTWRWPTGLLPLLLIALATSGCSIKGMAMNSMADALSGGGSNVYLTDNDPILVGDALPFSLKLMETILQETPEHEGLLVSAASGFVMYGTAWVLRPSRVMEATDLRAARVERARAKALFLRARGYAGRALEVQHPGILSELLMNPEITAQRLTGEDLPAMYWFAAAQGSALTSDMNDMDLVTDFTVVPVLIQRALELHEAWNNGAIHELMMVIPSSHGVTVEEKEHHFARAMELNGGSSIAPLVSLAESVCVPQQDRERFIQLLNQALAFDPEEYPEMRLSNVLAQEHASWLLSRIDELFLMTPADRTDLFDPTKVRILWPLHF